MSEYHVNPRHDHDVDDEARPRLRSVDDDATRALVRKILERNEVDERARRAGHNLVLDFSKPAE